MSDYYLIVNQSDDIIAVYDKEMKDQAVADWANESLVRLVPMNGVRPTVGNNLADVDGYLGETL